MTRPVPSPASAAASPVAAAGDLTSAAGRDGILRARMRHHWPTVVHGLEALYPSHADRLGTALADRVARHVAARRPELFARDLEREAEPDWFQAPDMIGYVAYADRFADTLHGVGEHLDYLDELGVSFLHLMPLLRARDGENDGGYAVASYDEIEPRLGTADDLRSLASSLHERRMNLCVDLVLNHTAAEHPWAQAARAGDEHHRRFYFFFPDRTMPDRYERTLREVFPAFAPGNFTWLADAEQWVWTTFHEYQWDLDWSNPDVLEAMVDVMLHLSDLGVDVLRLDAVPFMWKREGTGCENLPEVHTLLCTLRAIVAVASPATIFKAEAIVSPDQLVAYVGAGVPERHECELAYHNQLMVLLWSSLATGEARLMTNSLRRVARIPTHASWVTYVRCHDDIGWAITDEAAASVGWNGFDHRNFLNAFYSGAFPTSFALGEVFQFNPETGDGRISGSAAALCGIERATADGDAAHLDLACRRLELVYAVAAAFGGIPLLYMGDELGLPNDHSYLDDPARRDDNRWLHRPRMDWERAARRTAAGTIEARLFSSLRSLLADRAACGALHGATESDVLEPPDPALLVFVRRHPDRGSFAMLANFGHEPRRVGTAWIGLDAPTVVRASGATAVTGAGDEWQLSPMGYLWLSAGR